MGKHLVSYKKLIGKKIQKRRIEMGFSSQELLSTEMGIDQSQISRWESGKHIPEGLLKDALGKILDVTDDFFETIELSPETNEHLIGNIITILPTLDENQLRSVLALASGHASGTTGAAMINKVK